MAGIARKTTVLIVLALTFALMIAGCTGEPAANTAADEQDVAEESADEESAQETQTLVVSGWGGLWEETVTEHVYQPCEARLNVEIVHSLNAGFAEALAKQRAEIGDPTIDVFLTGGGFERIAADENLLEEFDHDAMPNLEDVYDGATYGDQVVANSVAGVGLVYHKERVPREPTSWYDLWDTEFSPVAISDISDTYGRALFVGINALEGGTVDNPEPGWEKMKELMETQEPIINLTTDDTTNAIVARGAALSVAPNSRAIQLIKEGLPVGFVYPEEGGFAWGTYMGVSKGTPNKQLAMEFINCWLDPEIQANWVSAVNYGPANLMAELPEDYGFEEYLIYHDTMEEARFLNWDEINEHISEWNEKWTTEVLPVLEE